MTFDPLAHQTDADRLVSYRLRQDGPPLYARLEPCWWCADPAHNGALLPGSSCPMRLVPLAALSPERRSLREVLS